MSWWCSISLVGYNLNLVVHLVPLLIIGRKHGLVHLYVRITLDFSSFGIKRPLSKFYLRKKTRIPICLTLGVNILALKKKKQLMLSHQCIVGASLWSAKDSMYLWIDLFFLAELYMHIISPSVESEARSSRICTLQQTATPKRVWIMTKTDRLMVSILAWYVLSWNYRQFWVV